MNVKKGIYIRNLQPSKSQVSNRYIGKNSNNHYSEFHKRVKKHQSMKESKIVENKVNLKLDNYK